MMRLFNRKLISGILQSLRDDRGDLQHHLHTDGEVGPIEQPGLLSFRQSAHIRQLVVPTGSSNDHFRACCETSTHILNCSLRRCKVDYHIESCNEWRRQSRGFSILLCIKHMHAVAALGRNLRDQLTGLAHPENQYPHRVCLPKRESSVEPGSQHQTLSHRGWQRSDRAGFALPPPHPPRQS